MTTVVCAAVVHDEVVVVLPATDQYLTADEKAEEGQ